MKRSALTKHIYKIGNRYSVSKSINNKHVYFNSFDNLNDAIEYRDRLRANGWKPVPDTPKIQREKNARKYYRNIQKGSHGYGYSIFYKDKYMGRTDTIEEALYFRDLARNGETRKPKELDLQTDNPYLNGLEYPVPERLIPKKKKEWYGKGTIVKKGDTSFHVHHGGRKNGNKSYVCACPTYEMAEYVRREMNERDWNMDELQEVLDGYPEYYTKLLFFYQYIHQGRYNKDKWDILIPKEYLDEGKQIELIPGYVNIEDALFERDFLMKHDWNYELLVECIDDTKNPYYDMELPPYPTRKIKNISRRNYREKELTRIAELIREGHTTLREMTEDLDCTEVTIRNWFKLWNTNWPEFKQIVINGENPLEVLEKKPQIYKPDLSRQKPPNFKDYVHEVKMPSGIRYSIMRKGVSYGVYPDYELAKKIRKDLEKAGWDKSRLTEIQAKHGWQSMMGSKRWVYKNGKYGWTVRRKDKNRRMITYWSGKDKRVACLIRDMLIMYGWNKEDMPWIKDIAESAIKMIEVIPGTMFGVKCIEDIEYIEDYGKVRCITKTKKGKWRIDKTLNGKRTYYGAYPTKDKAVEVLEFLEDNDWDKQALTMMKKIGAI